MELGMFFQVVQWDIPWYTGLTAAAHDTQDMT